MEASAQEVRGYYKQFAQSKHLEWKSRIDNEVFDLVDKREVQTEEFCDPMMGTSHQETDKQGNFFRAKARWVLRVFLR